MNYMRKMGGLISAIEDAGIKVKSATWESEDALNIYVDEADQELAGEIAQNYWMKQQEYHMEVIGLITVPAEN